MLTAICPTFPARDLRATARFYGDFGFAQIALFEAEGYLILARDRLEIHFWQAPEHRPESSDHGAYVRTADVDALAVPFAARGLPDAGIPRFVPPEDKPWGMREAVLIDPDGNLLRFGHEIAND